MCHESGWRHTQGTELCKSQVAKKKKQQKVLNKKK